MVKHVIVKLGLTASRCYCGVCDTFISIRVIYFAGSWLPQLKLLSSLFRACFTSYEHHSDWAIGALVVRVGLSGCMFSLFAFIMTLFDIVLGEKTSCDVAIKINSIQKDTQRSGG